MKNISKTLFCIVLLFLWYTPSMAQNNQELCLEVKNVTLNCVCRLNDLCHWNIEKPTTKEASSLSAEIVKANNLLIASHSLAERGHIISDKNKGKIPIIAEKIRNTMNTKENTDDVTKRIYGIQELKREAKILYKTIR